MFGIATGRICPRCGRANVGFVGALCSSCYVEVYGVAEVPSVVELTYCRMCGSYKYQGQWVEGLESLEETVREYTYIVLSQKLKPTQFIEEAWVKDVEISGSEARWEARITVNGRSGSVVVSDSRIVRVKVNATVCPSCMRRLSKTGYTAVVQVRPLIGGSTADLERRLEKLVAQMEARVKGSIISVERVKNGVDILVEDQNVARMIAAKLRSTLGGSVTETFKVTGVKPGGGRKGILTISVRVLNVKPGSLIAYQGVPHIVVGEVAKGLQLLNTHTGEITFVGYEDLGKATMLDARDYVGTLLKHLKLSRIDGENLLFTDVGGGQTLSINVNQAIVLSGALALGKSYLAYLLKGKLYIVGEATVE